LVCFGYLLLAAAIFAAPTLLLNATLVMVSWRQIGDKGLIFRRIKKMIFNILQVKLFFLSQSQDYVVVMSAEMLRC
jgi:hypothetical protein